MFMVVKVNHQNSCVSIHKCKDRSQARQLMRTRSVCDAALSEVGKQYLSIVGVVAFYPLYRAVKALGSGRSYYNLPSDEKEAIRDFKTFLEDIYDCSFSSQKCVIRDRNFENNYLVIDEVCFINNPILRTYNIV